MAFSTREAAAMLGTSAKVLRQFLRQDPGFGSVGSGGRYTFTEQDLNRMKAAFNAWVGQRALTTRSGAEDHDAEGMPVESLRMNDAATRAARAKLSRERVDRLEESLKERGLHISQMRDREGWAPR